MIYVTQAPLRIADNCMEAALALPADQYDRYENPFERKWALHQKHGLDRKIEAAVAHLEGYAEKIGELIGGFVETDASRHYLGLFRYGAGDKLDVHVDAGIHPTLGKRHIAVALLYMGECEGGELEFWDGTLCTRPGGGMDGFMPQLYDLEALVSPSHGMVVLFDCNDSSWHGVREVTRGNRFVLTVSFLSEGHIAGAYTNPRRRAYFVPRYDEVTTWDAETYRLRDLRADPERYEVYRT